MRVGLNCLRIDPAYKGGVNSFTFGLLDGFASLETPHQFILLAAPHNESLFKRFENRPNFHVHVIHEVNHRRIRRVLPRLPWQLRESLPYSWLNPLMSRPYDLEIDELVDLVYMPYSPTSIFPLGHRCSVISMHDIQQAHYPEFFSKEILYERAMSFPRWAYRADYLQASSEFMKHDFLKYFKRLRSEQVVVIPEGVDIEKFSAPVDTRYLSSKYGIPEQFLFFPAQLWHHKNHMTVLRALSVLKKKQGLEIPLVLTGAKYEASGYILKYMEENLKSQVHYLGLVPEEDIVALHQKARFLITAVLYESSSIPVREAAAAGTPIIASKTPPNEEVARILEMNLFPPTDEQALADLLQRVWPDDDLIRKQSEKNRIGIREFSWSRIASQYLDFFVRVASPSSATGTHGKP